MNWEELCNNAEIKGYKVERYDSGEHIKICPNNRYEVYFYKDVSIKTFCGWESIEFADNRTPDQMWRIIKDLME